MYNYLAATCTYSSAGVASESDMRLNKQDYNWVVSIGSDCSGKYSVEAASSHERGHTFGLDHVSETGHANLTMSTSINGTCQEAESTLGKGDIMALRALY